ncbi:lipopolysaccharide transport periplasmic protein LptA [Massilia aerilata]|uniref:Lipopolysaccharide export system protein LptA n=1 Tax=Massilia aerilata TaxID=453817 RepID=A0ABW0S3F8_9BURK
MKRALAAALALLLMPLAQAERADALKPFNVEGNKATIDQATQTVILTGNVIGTRGSMLLKAERAEIRETPEGYRSVVLFGANGKAASFRQKRDGGADEWDEGYGERMEYDERTDIVKLISHATIRQLDGRTVTREMSGPFISYDARKEVLLNMNDVSGADKPGKDRVSVTFYTRRPTPAAPPEAGKQ